MGPLFYPDHLHKGIGDLLALLNIKFIHRSQDKEQPFDFYLPIQGIYIQLKNFGSDRIGHELKARPNVILAQGIPSQRFLISLLHNQYYAGISSLRQDRSTNDPKRRAVE